MNVDPNDYEPEETPWALKEWLEHETRVMEWLIIGLIVALAFLLAAVTDTLPKQPVVSNMANGIGDAPAE